ncbi:hypothetical protein COI73_28970 [Bacillus cereus]|nr:hypothetical protein COI73_28970 [Bacillus cereus]
MLNKQDTLTSANDNYVNKLSIWAAYFIFCLAWFFSEMLAIPLHNLHLILCLINPLNGFGLVCLGYYFM